MMQEWQAPKEDEVAGRNHSLIVMVCSDGIDGL